MARTMILGHNTRLGRIGLPESAYCDTMLVRFYGNTSVPKRYGDCQGPSCGFAIFHGEVFNNHSMGLVEQTIRVDLDGRHRCA
jgi:hypothetical protein